MVGSGRALRAALRARYFALASLTASLVVLRAYLLGPSASGSSATSAGRTGGE